MKKNAILQTRTTNKLHFSDLDPSRFEDLCLGLIYPLKPWHDIRHYGRTGTDGGIDIMAIERLENGVPRNWFIQCRRYSNATKSTLKNAVDDVLRKAANAPNVLIVVIACDVRRESHEFFVQYATDKGIEIPLLWTQSILEAKLYSERKDLLFTYFGISDVLQSRNREENIRRNIIFKKRMRKDFLKDSYDPNLVSKSPYMRFKVSEAIIHSIDDTIYPAIDDRKTVEISSWFKVELYNFYHNGLEVVLGAHQGIINSEGKWAILKYGQYFDSQNYSLIRLIFIGRIPYRNIIEYDLDGDEYYNFPHIYCLFSDQGMPYEEFTYRGFGDEYDDFILDPKKQFDYQEKN